MAKLKKAEDLAGPKFVPDLEADPMIRIAAAMEYMASQTWRLEVQLIELDRSVMSVDQSISESQ